MAVLEKYGQIRNRDESQVKTFIDVDRQKAETILEGASASGRRTARTKPPGMPSDFL